MISEKFNPAPFARLEAGDGFALIIRCRALRLRGRCGGCHLEQPLIALTQRNVIAFAPNATGNIRFL
jgi:hypothetical protein